MSMIARIGTFVVKASAAVAIAFVLIQIVARLPTDMPAWLDISMRRMLHSAGREDLANPDGMEDLAELAFTALALVIGIAMVWGEHRLLRRRRGVRGAAGGGGVT